MTSQFPPTRTDPPIEETPPTTFPQKLLLLIKSRKFWALITALVAAVGAHATAQIDAWQMIQAIVAALAVYSASIAYVDAAAERQKP